MLNRASVTVIAVVLALSYGAVGIVAYTAGIGAVYLLSDQRMVPEDRIAAWDRTERQCTSLWMRHRDAAHEGD